MKKPHGRPAVPEEWSTRTRGLAACGIVLAGFLAYTSSFSGAFVFDDVGQIQSDALDDVRPLSGCLSSARGLVRCSFELSYRYGGSQPFGYHVVNLAIHLVAGLTLFGLLRRVLRLPKLAALRPLADPVAAATTLLWVVHPLNTQAVTYIIQRAESMMALFYLLTLYGAARSFEKPSHGWTAFAVCACLFGMCTKQVMITAPLAVLLIDRTLVTGRFTTALRARPLLYVGLVACAVWLFRMLSYGRAIVATRGGAGFTTAGVSPLDYFASQGGVILHYLKMALVPYPLCLDYYRRAATGFAAIGPTLLVFGFAVVAIVGMLRGRAGWLLVALFYLVLSPTSSIMPIADLEVEHRMYLPLALVLLGLVLLAASRTSQRALATGVVCCTLVLGALTYARNIDYHSGERLWTRVIAVRPDNPRAHYTLGTLLARQRAAARAIPSFERALALNPGDLDSITNLGMAHLQLGNVDRARKLFESGAASQQSSDALHLGLASIAMAEEDFVLAKRENERAIEANPENAAAHANLGTLLAVGGDLKAAEAEFLRAAAIRPGLFEAQNGLGLVYLALNDLDSARSAFVRAQMIDPQSRSVRNKLAALAQKTGPGGRP